MAHIFKTGILKVKIRTYNSPCCSLPSHEEDFQLLTLFTLVVLNPGCILVISSGHGAGLGFPGRDGGWVTVVKAPDPSH